MTRTLFEVYWYGMSGEARDAWIRRNVWTLARTLEETYWSRSLLEGADDLVIYTIERLLWDPTGEYAPHGEETPEAYYRRCLWVRIKAVARMARAGKRRYQGPNHIELDKLNGALPSTQTTPESQLVEREALAQAQRAIGRAVAKSRLRGITRLYAENFVQFAADGLGTADIAKRFKTNEANVRTARRRLMHLLVREGVIAESAARNSAIEREPREETIEAALGPASTEPRH